MLDVALMLAVVCGGAVAVKVLSSRGDPEGDAVWTAAARRVGGEVVIGPARLFLPVRRELHLTVDGIPLRVSTQLKSEGKHGVPFTRLVAGPLPASEGVRIHCAKRDLVHQVTKRLGLGELPTGHSDFDDKVHVGGSPASIVFAYLDGPTRGRVVDSDVGFDIDDRTLTVELEGLPDDAGLLVSLTRFGERLVQRWSALLASSERLAAHLDLSVEERFQLAANRPIASGVHRARLTRLTPRVDGDRAMMVLSFAEPTGEEWAMERDADAFTATGKPPPAIAAFAVSAPSSLLGMRWISGRVELFFDGLGPDSDEVKTSFNAALDATTPAGAYR